MVSCCCSFPCISHSLRSFCRREILPQISLIPRFFSAFIRDASPLASGAKTCFSLMICSKFFELFALVWDEFDEAGWCSVGVIAAFRHVNASPIEWCFNFVLFSVELVLSLTDRGLLNLWKPSLVFFSSEKCSLRLSNANAAICHDWVSWR